MPEGVMVHGLYARRQALGLSAQEVARRCGVCVDMYYRWEAGRQNPTWPKVQRLSRALRLPLAALLRDADRASR